MKKQRLLEEQITAFIAQARSAKSEYIMAEIPKDSQETVLESLNILVEAIREINNK